MPICKFMTKEMTYDKWLFFVLCQNNHIIKMYVTVLICKSCSMCELHMELFYFITVFTELFKGNSIFICNLVSITLSVRFFVAYLK